MQLIECGLGALSRVAGGKNELLCIFGHFFFIKSLFLTILVIFRQIYVHIRNQHEKLTLVAQCCVPSGKLLKKVFNGSRPVKPDFSPSGLFFRTCDHFQASTCIYLESARRVLSDEHIQLRFYFWAPKTWTPYIWLIWYHMTHQWVVHVSLGRVDIISTRTDEVKWNIGTLDQRHTLLD